MLLAQDPPCLSGWNYRTPIIINNSSSTETLTDYQVSLEVNTSELIANGKARIDGGDMRFLDKDGEVLSFWIENNTYNTSETQFWVNVPELLASQSDTIYFFYGQPTAASIADGEATFELFDDFLGGTIDGSKWNICNANQINVAGGSATFSSSAVSTDRATIQSLTSISSPVIIEQYIEEVVDGLSFVGLQNTSGDGYAMVYEDNSQPTMRLLKLEDGTDCRTLSDVHSSQDASRSANETEGIWSFSWLATDEQTFDWPGAVTTEVRNDVIHSFPTDVKVAIGNIDKVGSMEVDWLRVRKYTSIEPTTTIGTEVAGVTEVTATSTGAVCENEELNLFASAVTGAEYSWSGPDNFTSTDQNPTITNAGLLQAGYFKVTASITGGCSSASDSILVEVNPISVAGDLTGHLTICSGENSGTVELNNQTGDIVRWEISPTGLAPWSSITETSTSLAYENLVDLTYYRAIVKSGICSEIASDSVRLVVDENTIGGVVLGAGEVCSDVNLGTINLNSYLGTVQNWQYLEENTTNWVDIVGLLTNYDYSNLSTTTYYRTVIKNGVCSSVNSDSVKIKVNPLPAVNFDAPAVCYGVNSNFTNETTITEGILRNYSWDFSDGFNSTGENPQHAFSGDGTFSVTLRVESDEFCLAEIEQDVIVHPIPTVDFFHTNMCQEFEMPFTQNAFISSGGIDEFLWDFGDDSGTSILPQTEYLYDTSGVYSVKLVTVSSEQCKDSVTNEVIVYPRAELDFEVEDVFLGETSMFVNKSTIVEGNLTYNWFFQDGQSSILTNPTHDYQSAGSFDVVLISTSSNGLCNDTITETHVVNDQTKAEFSVADTCLYDSARFVNESFIAVGTLTYVWEFGDGAISTLENPNHKYENSGTYSVKLTASSNLGSLSSFTDLLTINTLPKAIFVVSDVCDEVTATYSNLSTISGGSMTYEWEFGDENTSYSIQPEHLYDSDGAYTVQLVAISNYNCTDTVVADIVIFPLPQTLFYVDAVCDGFPSFFTDSTKINSGSITDFSWNFGDGTNSIEEHPEQQFLDAGTYLVQLTTTSDKSCKTTYGENVIVYTGPIASFTVENVCFQESINPVNNSSSDEGQLTYQWVFGDGDSTTVTNTTHTYVNPLTYSLLLNIESEFGCKDSYYKSVTIYSLPTIEAGDDQTVSQGYSVTLSATGGEDYIWVPSDDLDNQGVDSPVATPFETTIFTVSVTDDNGCQGSASTIVTVEENFKLEASNVITPDGNNENDTWFVKNITSFEDVEVQIFDRWGQIIYEQTNYQNDWAGTSGTDVLSDGEYYYIITSPSSDKVYKGTITILRG